MNCNTSNLEAISTVFEGEVNKTSTPCITFVDQGMEVVEVAWTYENTIYSLTIKHLAGGICLAKCGSKGIPCWGAVREQHREDPKLQVAPVVCLFKFFWDEWPGIAWKAFRLCEMSKVEQKPQLLGFIRPGKPRGQDG
jgi:hypothetical protein